MTEHHNIGTGYVSKNGYE